MLYLFQISSISSGANSLLIWIHFVDENSVDPCELASSGSTLFVGVFNQKIV